MSDTTNQDADEVWVVLPFAGDAQWKEFVSIACATERDAHSTCGTAEHVTRYIHADRHAAELAAARQTHIDDLKVATSAVSRLEAGTIADLTAARQRIQELEAMLKPYRCPECGGLGWNVGECHPQETCGICGGSGLVKLGGAS